MIRTIQQKESVLIYCILLSYSIYNILMLEDDSDYRLETAPSTPDHFRSDPQRCTIAKKKPFARKPAASNSSVTSEQHRKTIKQRVQVAENSPRDISQGSNEQTDPQTPIKMNFTGRRQRQSEFFKKAPEQPSKNTCNSFYSPRAASKLPTVFGTDQKYKNLLTKLIGQKQHKMEQKSENSCNASINLGKRIIKQSKNNSNVLPNKYEHENRSISTFLSFKQLDQKVAEPRQLPFNRSFHQRSEKIVLECDFCKNNKKLSELIAEKCKKLEEQLKSKIYLLTDLTSKYDCLTEEDKTVKRGYEEHEKKYRLERNRLLLQNDDLKQRLDVFQKDIFKLSEKLRYTEIENAILMRYKDEYMLITKEFDQVRMENEQLKRQLELCQNDSFGLPFSKTQRFGIASTISRLNLKGNKVHQDDAISLELSERSSLDPN